MEEETLVFTLLKMDSDLTFGPDEHVAIDF